MFGKYKFEAGFVKKNNARPTYESTEQPYRNTPEDNIRLVKGIVKELVVGAVVTFGAVVAINTISEIATNRLGQPSQKELES